MSVSFFKLKRFKQREGFAHHYLWFRAFPLSSLILWLGNPGYPDCLLELAFEGWTKLPQRWVEHQMRGHTTGGEGRVVTPFLWNYQVFTTLKMHITNTIMLTFGGIQPKRIFVKFLSCSCIVLNQKQLKSSAIESAKFYMKWHSCCQKS